MTRTESSLDLGSLAWPLQSLLPLRGLIAVYSDPSQFPLPRKDWAFSAPNLWVNGYWMIGFNIFSSVNFCPGSPFPHFNTCDLCQ